jgi:hypothetical protein
MHSLHFYLSSPKSFFYQQQLVHLASPSLHHPCGQRATVALCTPLSCCAWKKETEAYILQRFGLPSLSLPFQFIPDPQSALISSPGHHHDPMQQRHEVDHPAAHSLLISPRWAPDFRPVMLRALLLHWLRQCTDLSSLPALRTLPRPALSHSSHAVLAMLVATATWARRSVPSAPVYPNARQHAEVLIRVFGL